MSVVSIISAKISTRSILSCVKMSNYSFKQNRNKYQCYTFIIGPLLVLFAVIVVITSIILLWSYKSWWSIHLGNVLLRAWHAAFITHIDTNHTTRSEHTKTLDRGSSRDACSHVNSIVRAFSSLVRNYDVTLWVRASGLWYKGESAACRAVVSHLNEHRHSYK